MDTEKLANPDSNKQVELQQGELQQITTAGELQQRTEAGELQQRTEEEELRRKLEEEERQREKEERKKEIEELTALSKKQFKTGMIIMVGSLLVTLICALTGTAMERLYNSNPIQTQLDFVVKACSYVFYVGLFFIIRYYITRRKIPRDY